MDASPAHASGGPLKKAIRRGRDRLLRHDFSQERLGTHSLTYCRLSALRAAGAYFDKDRASPGRGQLTSSRHMMADAERSRAGRRGWRDQILRDDDDIDCSRGVLEAIPLAASACSPSAG
ncbi:hypothetical protein JMJ77_0000525 [Colletotrichum scovillei]|uniref:Uncharacterized protein n=1 Tax=Colletotrichum scovillei TaxID=1209932 RepID=A0A9P7UHF5_9PEZI|nr:hypothetical protein JMJ77_0000525 [Colletotrichum scovillei]KAG7071732.1 hypothetical protein JMJ76_0004600 [Colletotrichum scovillei]KAG7079945.1 hypothetical protein JMJ78_0007048 [Colletotrichum scovillei]